METEEINSLMGIVRQLHKDMKDISDKHPEQPVRWDTAEIFNNILTQTKQLLKNQPVIKQIQLLKAPQVDESVCALRVVDMVAKLSVIKGALEEYRRTHEPPLRARGFKQIGDIG